MARLRSWRSWALGDRIGLAMTLAAVLLIAAVAVSAVTAAAVQRGQDRVMIHYFAAIERSRQNLLLLVDAETAIRDAILSREAGDPAALEPAGRPWEPVAADPVRHLLADEPEVVRRLDAATDASREWYEGWARPVAARLATGERVPQVELDRGGRLFAQVRVTYDAYFASVIEARDRAREEVRLRVEVLFVAVVSSAATGGVTFVLLWWLLRRWVSRPVGRLAAEARRVRGGDLDHAVGVDGPPDIRDLAEDVDAMRRWLVEQIEQLRAAGREMAEARDRIERQATELERSNRDLEQFAYVASHDLQEPLRKVAGFCQLLQRRYAGQLDERADQYVEFAVDGAKRMQRLINDLLAFSRVGRSTVPRTEVDLASCARAAVHDLSALVDSTGAEVTWEPLPRVPGDARLLTQVYGNLLANAIKFHGDRPPRVRLGARRDGDRWELWCQDEGIGIEPEYAERVFVIFQRLHGREAYDGTGIGLALCKRIVEYHGGRIWVDTDVPRGTTIRWTLPAG